MNPETKRTLSDPTPKNYCCAPCALRALWEGYGNEPDHALTADARALRDVLRFLVSMKPAKVAQLVRAAEALK